MISANAAASSVSSITLVPFSSDPAFAFFGSAFRLHDGEAERRRADGRVCAAAFDLRVDSGFSCTAARFPPVFFGDRVVLPFGDAVLFLVVFADEAVPFAVFFALLSVFDFAEVFGFAAEPRDEAAERLPTLAEAPPVFLRGFSSISKNKFSFLELPAIAKTFPRR